MPPKGEGPAPRRRGGRAARGSTRGRGGRGGAAAQVAAASQEEPVEAAAASQATAGDEDSLFMPKDDPMTDAPPPATEPADVSMTDVSAGPTTTEAAAADASAGATRPEDARVSSVRGSQTPAGGSPAPGSPASASAAAARGGKKSLNRMPTNRGRRSKEERDAMMAESERKRKEKLSELDSAPGRGRGDRGRGGRGRGGDRGGRGGRGGYMGQRGYDPDTKQDMGGVFASGTVNENRQRMIHRGKTFGSSSTGVVKRERTVFKADGGEGSKNEEPEDGGYISSDPEIEQLGPRQDVDEIAYVNLVSDEEDGDGETPAAGPSSHSRRSRSRFNTPGLAPVRIQRREHENAPRKITAEAPGDPEIKTEPDATSPRKSKGKTKDVEVTGSQGRWKGAWGWKEDEDGTVTIKDEPGEEASTVPSEIPEPAVKDAPSSPELSKKSKPKIKQRRKPRFRDLRANAVSEEDKQEHDRHEQSMTVLADELGQVVLPPAGATETDGDTPMAEGSEKPEAEKQDLALEDKKADRVYLFQLPPVLPSLMIDESVKQEPQSPDETTRANPIDLSAAPDAKPPANSATAPIKTEDEAANAHMDAVSPDLPLHLSSGCVGKLRVHKSGRATLDWAGTSLELQMGMSASFLQDIIVTRVTPEEQRVGRDGGEAMSFGQVRGKFVVTPDWDEIVG